MWKLHHTGCICLLYGSVKSQFMLSVITFIAPNSLAPVHPFAAPCFMKIIIRSFALNFISKVVLLKKKFNVGVSSVCFIWKWVSRTKEHTKSSQDDNDDIMKMKSWEVFFEMHLIYSIGLLRLEHFLFIERLTILRL